MIWYNMIWYNIICAHVCDGPALEVAQITGAWLGDQGALLWLGNRSPGVWLIATPLAPAPLDLAFPKERSLWNGGPKTMALCRWSRPRMRGATWRRCSRDVSAVSPTCRLWPPQSWSRSSAPVPPRVWQRGAWALAEKRCDWCRPFSWARFPVFSDPGSAGSLAMAKTRGIACGRCTGGECSGMREYILVPSGICRPPASTRIPVIDLAHPYLWVDLWTSCACIWWWVRTPLIHLRRVLGVMPPYPRPRVEQMNEEEPSLVYLARKCTWSESEQDTIPCCTAPHRTAPHRTAPHRTAPHRAEIDRAQADPSGAWWPKVLSSPTASLQSSAMCVCVCRVLPGSEMYLCFATWWRAEVGPSWVLCRTGPCSVVLRSRCHVILARYCALSDCLWHGATICVGIRCDCKIRSHPL